MTELSPSVSKTSPSGYLWCTVNPGYMSERCTSKKWCWWLLISTLWAGTLKSSNGIYNTAALIIIVLRFDMTLPTLRAMYTGNQVAVSPIIMVPDLRTMIHAFLFPKRRNDETSMWLDELILSCLQDNFKLWPTRMVRPNGSVTDVKPASIIHNNSLSAMTKRKIVLCFCNQKFARNALRKGIPNHIQLWIKTVWAHWLWRLGRPSDTTIVIE